MNSYNKSLLFLGISFLISYSPVLAADQVPNVDYLKSASSYILPEELTHIGSGDTTKYYEWSQNSVGNYAFSEVTVPSSGKQTITVKYNSNSTSFDNVFENITKTGSKTNVGDYSTSGELSGGAVVNNPSGNTVSFENTLFQNNIYEGTLINTENEGHSLNIQGGAIYNEGSITTISGAFISNIVKSKTESPEYRATVQPQGGAIFNKGNIGDIVADFVNNSATGTSEKGGFASYGGAIYNSGEIASITGGFYGNTAAGDITGFAYDSYGGAIYNEGIINEIKGDFVGNSSDAFRANGGAIYNKGDIGNITGNFIGNYGAREGANWSSYGGAIYNDSGTIGDIKGSFIGNYVRAYLPSNYTYIYAKGGAINNLGEMGNIDGDFVGNYISSSYAFQTQGGAIYNQSIIKDINGSFIGNYIKNDSAGGSYGGAIYNCKTIGHITGDFIGNYIYSYRENIGDISPGAPYGGAIYNGGLYGSVGAQIESITGNFIGNYISIPLEAIPYGQAKGGAIYNGDIIGNIKGSFINNYIYFPSYISNGFPFQVQGGAIYNRGTIGNIDGDFIGNYINAGGASGGAIYNSKIIGNITGDFQNNYAFGGINTSGGAIYNSMTIGNIKGNFTGNYVSVFDSIDSVITAKGGAIYNTGNLGYDKDGNKIGGLINSSFINNYAKAENNANPEKAVAKGGAIYSEKSLDIIADNGVSLFSGNYTEVNGKKESNAIYITKSVDSTDSVALTLKAENNGVIQFDDKISGGAYSTDADRNAIYLEDASHAYNLDIKGDSTGQVIFNNDIQNANININDTNVYVAQSRYLSESPSLSLNSGTLTFGTLGSENVHLDSLTLNGNVYINNVDVDLANARMGRLTAENYGASAGTINVRNLTLTSDSVSDVTSILFADPQIAQNVVYTGSPHMTGYTPIYQYDINYNSSGGNFTFSKAGYNPSVLPGPTVNQTGGVTTQIQTSAAALDHAAAFMNIPYMERISIKNRNRYALSPTGDATDVGVFSPIFTKTYDNAFWVRPYTSFESVPLKNGPKVSNINYGTLVGYDSKMQNIRHGFERVITGYIGYNGASQRFLGVDSYQNGGIIGSTVTLYKGNFFTATTASVGATAGTNNTMYGNENFTMLISGIANKSGYNFEFLSGKLILQPSFLISYTFVNTFDYNNAAGLKIKSDPLNAIQLAPGVKLIGNMKNGLQPYIGVNMVWNLLDKSKVTADDVRLPEMSIDPYVEYGVGLQKRWSGRYMAYVQAMIRNGGRNGISLTGGFRWAVGKDPSKTSNKKNPLVKLGFMDSNKN